MRSAWGLRLGVLAVVLVLLAVACGADDGPDVAADSGAAEAGATGSGGIDLQGLTVCDAIPTIASSVEGPLGAAANPPDDAMQALSNYGQRNADIFGGLWIDRGAGSVVIAVTEDPEVHRAAITAEAGLGERDDIAVDVVQVTYTEAELLSVLNSLFDGNSRISSLTSGGPSIAQNVVALDLIDPTPEDLAQLSDTVDLDQVCVTVTITPPRPTGVVEVLPADPSQQRLTCGGSDTFALAALDDPVPVESSNHPAAVAALALFSEDDEGLGEELGSMFGDDPELFVLDIGEDQALFATIEADGLPGANVRVSLRTEGWRATGFGGGCSNLSVAYPEGLNQVEISLDPDSPPAADQTEIALLVTERECASGQPMGDRLLDPQIVETDDRVLLVFAAAAQFGAADCQGNPSTSVTVTLSEPLGDRELLDAGIFPPAPIMTGEGDS